MIYDTLRRLRIEKNFTQTQLAGKLGVSIDTIKNWESEKRTTEPQYSKLKEICKILEVSINELMEEPVQTPQPTQPQVLNNSQCIYGNNSGVAINNNAIKASESISPEEEISDHLKHIRSLLPKLTSLGMTTILQGQLMCCEDALEQIIKSLKTEKVRRHKRIIARAKKATQVKKEHYVKWLDPLTQ